MAARLLIIGNEIKKTFCKFTLLSSPVLISLVIATLGCKNRKDSSSEPSSSAQAESQAMTYNPFGSGMVTRNGNVPELGNAKSCDSAHFLVAGYCIKLANFNVFKSGEEEFYAIGNTCEQTPSSCGVPAGYMFSEVRFKVLVEPEAKIIEFLPPLEGIQKSSQILFTLSSLEAQSRVANEGFKSLGVVAYLSPFPVGEGKQMVQYEKGSSCKYGLSGLPSTEGYLASSFGYIVPR